MEPPAHCSEMLRVGFTPEQYLIAKQQVKEYNRAVARSMSGEDDKAMVSAIQRLDEWSKSYTDPQ